MPGFIERLSFTTDARYDALEASIHLNRYLLAKPYCLGRRVLDISCGEGYGSYAMAEFWGASSVDAVDISSEALDHAKRNFSSSKITWYCHDAETIEEVLPAEAFDLIVSLESIEHMEHPDRFLEQISRLLKPGGTVILSCPNDHWYYPDGTGANPFHLHRFHFEEFKALTERYLGRRSQFLLGLPITGFGNFPVHAAGGSEQRTIAQSTFALFDCPTLQLSVPPQEAILPANCSYFVGIWNGDDAPLSATIFPRAMGEETTALSRIQKTDPTADLRQQLQATQHALAEQRAQLQAMLTSRNIILAELEYSQSELARVKEAQTVPQVPPTFPRRLVHWAKNRIAPGRLRQILKKLFLLAKALKRRLGI